MLQHSLRKSINNGLPIGSWVTIRQLTMETVHLDSMGEESMEDVSNYYYTSYRRCSTGEQVKLLLQFHSYWTLDVGSSIEGTGGLMRDSLSRELWLYPSFPPWILNSY